MKSKVLPDTERTVCLALPDGWRCPAVAIAVTYVSGQLQEAIHPHDVGNTRPFELVLVLVAAQERSRSTLEPGEAPVRELGQRRQNLTGSEIGLAPELAATPAPAMFGIETEPHGLRVDTLVGRETQVLGPEARPTAFGAARGGYDIVPQIVERARHVQQQDFRRGLRLEVHGRLGKNGVRPKLACTRELLAGGAPPGGWVPVQRLGQLALDDVLERLPDKEGIERAVADTLDDLVVLGGDTDQLLGGSHDDLFFAVGFSDAMCSGDLNC